jgi:hypothetical protein
MAFKVKANKKKGNSNKNSSVEKTANDIFLEKNDIEKDIDETEKTQNMEENKTQTTDIVKVPEESTEPKKTSWASTQGTPKFEVVQDKEKINPFKEQPIIRDSGLASNQADNTQPISQEKVIPEPDITPNDGETSGVGSSYTSNADSEKETGGNIGSDMQGGDEGADKPIDNVNPAMDALSDTDKFKAAKAAATEIVNVYCTYKPALFTWISKPNKKKIKKLVSEGELDMSVKIETEDGQIDTFKNYIKDIEVQSETIYTPADDFKERIIPPLTEVLLKRNIGLTPENQCIAIVAQDLGSSTFQLVQLKKYTSTLIEHASDLSRQVSVNRRELDIEIQQLRAERDAQKIRADKAEKMVSEIAPDAKIVESKSFKKKKDEIKNITIDEGDDIDITLKPEEYDSQII